MRTDLPMQDEICQLSLPWRLAWGATLVEAVLGFYSESARRLYMHDETLAHVWAYVLDSVDVDDQTENLLSASLEEILETHKDGTYSILFRVMSVQLLMEIPRDNGMTVSAAAESVLESFLDVSFFAQGYPPGDPAIPQDYCDRLRILFCDFAWKLYDATVRCEKENTLSREMLSVVNLECDIDLLPRRDLDEIDMSYVPLKWECQNQKRKEL